MYELTGKLHSAQQTSTPKDLILNFVSNPKIVIMRAYSMISLVFVLVLGLVSQISKTLLIDTYHEILQFSIPRRWPDNRMQH